MCLLVFCLFVFVILSESIRWFLLYVMLYKLVVNYYIKDEIVEDIRVFF